MTAAQHHACIREGCKPCHFCVAGSLKLTRPVPHVCVLQVNATVIATALTAVYTIVDTSGSCLTCNSQLELALRAAFCGQVCARAGHWTGVEGAVRRLPRVGSGAAMCLGRSKPVQSQHVQQSRADSIHTACMKFSQDMELRVQWQVQMSCLLCSICLHPTAS
jgi:hypothetical protein